MRVPMMYALLIPIWLTPHEDVDERPRLLEAIERLDVSEIVTSGEYQIPFETHLTVEGSGRVAAEIAEWLRTGPRWTSGLASD